MTNDRFRRAEDGRPVGGIFVHANKAGDIMWASDNMGTNVKFEQSVKVRLGAHGRIVIPAALREQMGVKPGETLLLDMQDGALRIESHRARIRRIQEELKHYSKPGVLASDELIAERREEARREMEGDCG